MSFLNNRQKIGIGLSFVASFFIGCGGSGSGSDTQASLSSSSSSSQNETKIVTLMDEYILNAIVTDESNQQTVELGAGKYKFDKEIKGFIHATGGFIDVNLNNTVDSEDIPFSKTFKAKNVSSVITPLTTLIAEDPSVEDKIKALFNITSEDINADYVALKNIKLLKLNKAIYVVIKEDRLKDCLAIIKNQDIVNSDSFYDSIKNILSTNGALYIDKLVAFDGKFEEFNSVVKPLESSSSSTSTQTSLSSSSSSTASSFSSLESSSSSISSSSISPSVSSTTIGNDGGYYSNNANTQTSSTTSNISKKVTVIDDPISDADVLVYDINFTTLLFSAKTNSNGEATFDNNSSENYFTFKTVGGFMNNKSFNGSLFSIGESNASNFSITPMTSFLFKLVQKNDGTTQEKIEKSLNILQNAFPTITNFYSVDNNFTKFRNYVEKNVSVDYLIDFIAEDLVDGEIDSKILENIAGIKQNKTAIQQKKQEEFAQLFNLNAQTTDANVSSEAIISKVGSQGIALNIPFGDKNIVEANRSQEGSDDITKTIITKDVAKVAIQKLDRASKDIANTDNLTVEKFSDDKTISKDKQLELDQKLQNAKQVVEELTKKDINITADDLSIYNFKPIPFILRANSNISSFIKVDSLKSSMTDMTVAITPYKELHAIPNLSDINYSSDGYFPIAGADISVKDSSGKFIDNPAEQSFAAEIVPFMSIDNIFSAEVKKELIDGKLDVKVKRLFLSDNRWRDETYPLDINNSKIGGNDPITLNAKLSTNKRFLTLEDGAFLTNLAPFIFVAKYKDTNQTVLAKKSVPTPTEFYLEINATYPSVVASLYHKSYENELAYSRRAINQGANVLHLDLPYQLLLNENELDSSKKEFILSLDYNNETRNIYLSLDDIKKSSKTDRYSIDLTKEPVVEPEFEVYPILDKVLEKDEEFTAPIYIDATENYNYTIEATSTNEDIVKVLTVDNQNRTISLKAIDEGKATINYSVKVGDYTENYSFDVTTVADTNKIFITSSSLTPPPSNFGLFDKVSLMQDTNKSVVIYVENIKPIDLNYTLLSQPLHGVINFDTINGEYTYSPYKGFYGKDGFAYKISNSLGEFENHLVSLTITKASDLPTNTISLSSLYIANNLMTLTNSGDFGTIYHAPVEILENNLSNVATLYNISFALNSNLYYGGTKEANISMLVKSKSDSRTVLAVLPVSFSKSVDGIYSATTTGKIYGYGKDSKNNQFSVEKTLSSTKNLIDDNGSMITFDTDYIFTELANDVLFGPKMKNAITNASTKDGSYELYYGLSNGLVFEKSSEVNLSSMLNVPSSISLMNMMKGNLVIDSNYTANYISAIDLSKVPYSYIIDALNKPTTPPSVQSFDLEVKDVKIIKTQTGVKVDFEPATNSSVFGYQIRYASVDENKSNIVSSDGNISELFINDLNTTKNYQFVICTKHNSSELYCGWYNVYQFAY